VEIEMSEELVKRLRTTAGNPAICKDAAATIERLTRERDEFRDRFRDKARAFLDAIEDAKAAKRAKGYRRT
jgi:hypothetical protein